MRFRCPDNSKHKSKTRNACSVCGATMSLTTHAGTNPAPPKGKSKRSSRRCLNCGADLDIKEPVCERCGCQYFGVDNQPLEDTPPAKGKTRMGPEEILERVLAKQSGGNASGGNATPLLQAMLSVDRRRRPVRPVDDPEPPTPAKRLYVMDAETLPFGRVSNWMEIQDVGISRAHGEFLRQSDGSYCIRDVGSANGTTVNGTKLEKGELRKIKPGDEIIVGFWHMIQITWGT
jgi:hypothetical protein